MRYLIPLAVFVVIAGFLAAGLKLNPREVPSPFVDKPAPAFTLPRLDNTQQTIGTADMLDRVWLLNVWASWCAACYTEHPLLNDLAAEGITIIGLNHKDKDADAKRWLSDLGNPYEMIAVDMDGAVSIEWGVYGVPETFVIDKAGTVRYKHIGPVTEQDLAQTIRPLLETLQQENNKQVSRLPTQKRTAA
ncbi:MAG: DsbE family thiol:disulfide interchange protein [Gammaproteobacteria bacterium]|nr:DsbE family thiol:disulfide interchange protein [Gammaproteobacteria bacterium]